MNRLPGSLAVAAVGALLLWVALSLNTIIVIGYEYDYLSEGRSPLYPSVKVTPLSLSRIGVPIVLLYALVTGLVTFMGYRWPLWPLLALIWLGAAWIAAGFIAFQFQIDFGATWTTTEAIQAFFYRAYVSIPLAAVSVLFFILATRRIMRARPRGFL